MLTTRIITRRIKFLSRVLTIRLSSRKPDFDKWRKTRMANEEMPPSRSDPIITKLDTPEFHSIFTPELKILSEIFKKYNYEIRIAGGAVRDLLSGMTPKDLDFATTATPNEMKVMLTKEEIRMINDRGEKHGTITARINDKENFEVTTLRIDVATDGRHADVEFTKDWKLDANRRDLTINSMFLDFDGSVYDYFYGYDDLKKKRVAFVGDPATRIREDYLRIFRYFRFYGRISEVPDNHEDSTISAIKETAAGLERISGERIWSEWSKILEGRFGFELTAKMLDCGVAPYIGLPKNPDLATFEKVYSRAVENKLNLRPITLISALLRDEEEVIKLHERLRLSAFNRDLAFFMVQHREDKPCEKPLQPYQYIVINTKSKVQDIREFICELLRYKGSLRLLDDFKKWEMPKFPITGHHLKSHVPHGKMIGRVMTGLKNIWLNDDFKTSFDDLMKRVPDILAHLEETRKK